MDQARRTSAVIALVVAALASIATKYVTPSVMFELETQTVTVDPVLPAVVEVTLDVAWSEDARDHATIGRADLVVELAFLEAAPRGVRVTAVDQDGLETALQPGESGLYVWSGADCGPDACTGSVVITFDHEEGARRPLRPVERAFTVDVRASAYVYITEWRDQDDLDGVITLTEPA